MYKLKPTINLPEENIVKYCYSVVAGKEFFFRQESKSSEYERISDQLDFIKMLNVC